MELHRNTTPQGLSSERLKKAIERNRAKQARKPGLGQSSLSSPSRGGTSKLWGMTKPNLGQSTSISAPGRSKITTGISASRTQRLSSRPKLPGSKAASAGTTSRQSVATPGNFKFTNGLSSVSKNKTSTLKSTTVPRRSKTIKSVKNKETKFDWVKMLVISGWCFSLFLLLRLVFAERGVMDFYSRKSAFHRKEVEFKDTIIKNENLLKEIKLIKNNYRYQKKLVRDNLGYIAKDEYLILFESDS